MEAFGDVLRWVVQGIVVLVLIDQAALAAERRGWIRWRRQPPRRATVSRAGLQVQSIFEPSVEHVVEEQSQIGAVVDEDGAPPT